jgi:hypothetical protein
VNLIIIVPLLLSGSGNLSVKGRLGKREREAIYFCSHPIYAAFIGILKCLCAVEVEGLFFFLENSQYGLEM